MPVVLLDVVPHRVSWFLVLVGGAGLCLFFQAFVRDCRLVVAAPMDSPLRQAHALPQGLADTTELVPQLDKAGKQLSLALQACRVTLYALVEAAEAASDLPAACRLHAHAAVACTLMEAEEWTDDTLSRFLASVAFVCSWHVPEHGAGMRDAESTSFGSVGHSGARRYEDGETPPVPLAAMFHALHVQSLSLRDRLAQESVSLPNALRAVVMASVHGVGSAARQPMPGVPTQQGEPVQQRARSRSLSITRPPEDSTESQWGRVPRMPLCEAVVESGHPYKPADTYHTLSFPGAAYVKVRGVMRVYVCESVQVEGGFTVGLVMS